MYVYINSLEKGYTVTPLIYIYISYIYDIQHILIISKLKSFLDIILVYLLLCEKVTSDDLLLLIPWVPQVGIQIKKNTTYHNNIITS